MSGGPDIGVRRVYDPAQPDDGCRVLVDRIWPRGLSKAAAAIDEWCRDIAPSTELRRWYGHRPERFARFRERYLAELEEPPRAEAVTRLSNLDVPALTLVTATRKLDTSHARVLADRLAAGSAQTCAAKVLVRKEKMHRGQAKSDGARSGTVVRGEGGDARP